MDNANLKRNYIRRKKTYNKSLTLVRQTLQLISLVKKVKMSSTELDQLAKQHTDRVEAACWDPRTKITDDVYQQLVIQKTRELCNLLINRYAPQINTINLLIQMHGNKLLQNTLAEENPKQEPKIPSNLNLSLNSNENQMNSLFLETDKSNSFVTLNDDFPIRSESPNLFSSYINQEDTNYALNYDFNENIMQLPDT